jgi:hypothetical protein
MKKTVLELQAESGKDIAIFHHVDSALPMIGAVVHSTEAGDTIYHADGSMLIVKSVLRLDGERPVYNMLYPVADLAVDSLPVSETRICLALNEESELQEDKYFDDSIVNDSSEDPDFIDEDGED